MDDTQQASDLWREFLLTGNHRLQTVKRFLSLLPASPRCKTCYSPFGGPGGFVMRFTGRRPSKMNPQVCDVCFRFAEEHQGGAEVPLSLLFADIRGSSSLAESLGTREFSALIARFYDAVTHELVKANALIDRLIGDEVIALFVPGLAGAKHAEAAFHAARGILQATGHGTSEGPWVPVGVGLHTGTAFVGSIGKSGVSDITALGDDVNLTARLASAAAAGEILLTDTARAGAGVDTAQLEPRHLEIKGKKEPVDVWLMRLKSAPAANVAKGG